jgi:hypothetical protein
VDRNALQNVVYRELDHLMQRDNPDYKGAFDKRNTKPNLFKEK